MTRNQEIASEILNQLGGNKFLVMTGASNLLAINNGLRMNLPKNMSSANLLYITLGGDDLYTMRFDCWRKRRKIKGSLFDFEPDKITTVKEFEGVFFDQLQELFTSVTGMYTKLF